MSAIMYRNCVKCLIVAISQLFVQGIVLVLFVKGGSLQRNKLCKLPIYLLVNISLLMRFFFKIVLKNSKLIQSVYKSTHVCFFYNNR